MTSVLLVILTIYLGHSAQTTTVPVESMRVCRQLAASLDRQVSTMRPPPGTEVLVIARCIEASGAPASP